MFSKPKDSTAPAPMALAPVAAHWPEIAPLLYGGTLASLLWYWAYIKGPGNPVEAE